MQPANVPPAPMQPVSFFARLWQDYAALAPTVSGIRVRLEARGEEVANDHVAFRTFDLDPISLDALEPLILAMGYQRFQPYEFPEKRLRAFGYVHPDGHPRIFLSELLTAQFTPWLQEQVKSLCAQVDPARVQDASVFWAGRLWAPISYDLFKLLDQESEYAAWVAIHGLRPNHFTVSVNQLKTLPTLEQLLGFVKSLGYELNESGGLIKGSPEVLLEQGSTLADQLDIEFTDGRHRVPTCYYEFARRYPDASGRLYDGFVAASADKIFESTNLQKPS